MTFVAGSTVKALMPVTARVERLGVGLEGPCTAGPLTYVVGRGATDALESADCDVALGRVDVECDEDELLDEELDELEDEDELELELALRRLVAANAGLAVVSMSPAMNAAARNDFAVVLINVCIKIRNNKLPGLGVMSGLYNIRNNMSMT